MKVIITGGTGLIGRALTRRLIDDGDEVVILSRSGRRPGHLPQSAKILTWDSLSGEGWSHELANANAVVNLAGESIGAGRWTEARKQRIYDSRVNAGRAIVDAAERAGAAPERLIQASGVNYYGHRDDTRLTESEPPGEGFLTRVCIDWEQSTAPLENMGTSRAVVRNGVVLDANEGALPQIALPFRFFVGGRIASGRQGFSWMHIDDHVEALRYLLHNHELTGAINLTAPYPVSNEEFSKALGRAMDRPSLFPVPAFALKILVGEFAEHLINGQYVIPARLDEAGFRFRFPTIDAALQHLLGL